MKIYAIESKSANGRTYFINGFHSKAEALNHIKFMQNTAKYEMQHHESPAMEVNGLSFKDSYVPEWTLIEFSLMEAEKPEWEKIHTYSVEDNI